MTATADIITMTRENVLQVPNAALRFAPSASDPEPMRAGGGWVEKLMPRPPSQPPKAQVPTINGTPRVWVLQHGQVVPIEIRTGASNGQMTEVVGGSLEAGTEVITEAIGARP
jgi:HlyD family secretion protein